VRDQFASRPPAWAALVDLLIAGLAHPNPAVRCSCAHDLDTFDDGRGAAALAPLIDDPVPRVRTMAMHALVCDACKTAPRPWAEDICRRVAAHALNDVSVNVRRHAVVHIARCDPSLAVETLRSVLERETDERARRQAQRELKQFQGRHPSESRRESAIRSGGGA
jgi:HEAT repeat protein